MAALYEGCTLCELVPAQNQSNSGVKGFEEERDSDHVLRTDSSGSVTLYKVQSDPGLGALSPGGLSWETRVRGSISDTEK